MEGGRGGGGGGGGGGDEVRGKSFNVLVGCRSQRQCLFFFVSLLLHIARPAYIAVGNRRKKII